MECNKYEAIRAREFAETKMQKNDFVGARKFALKAQQLYPDTDNISQLITVCDVHCASQKKIDAYEKDWYAILQIAQTADESVIKKHYRKLALLLHPDKNKFPGAEAAFKLIGEAQRLLSDPVKRRMHDMKRKNYVKPSVPYQQPNNQYAEKQSFQNGFKGPPVPQYANVNLRKQHQPPPQPAFSVSTFATVCPHCISRRHAPVSDKHRPVICFSCNKSFIALEVKSDNLPKDKNDKKAAFVKKEVPNQQQSATVVNPKENKHSKDLPSNGSSEAGSSMGGTKQRNDIKSKKVNQRKRKKSEDSEQESESDTNDDETFAADDKLGNGHGVGNGLRNPRRSTRQKQNFSYDESRIDDDDLLYQDKTPKVSSTSGGENEGVKLKGFTYKSSPGVSKTVSNKSPNHCNRAQKSKKEFPAEGGVKTSSYSYPDPDFNSFADIRKEECFKVGQIWALYDDIDAMPRFYGRVKTICRSNKTLRLTWLEKVSDDDMTQKSASSLLPCSCGKYSTGVVQTLNMNDAKFSHPVVWEMGSNKYTYFIYPRQGQIWALFKNWNPYQPSNSISVKTFEYDYVEVVSHYLESRGVTVAHLGKAKGHASIFCRVDSDGTTHCIPQDEIGRFSHMIPAFQLNNEERGVFELDPASVPVNEKPVVDLSGLKILPGNFRPSFEDNHDVTSTTRSMDNSSGNESDNPDSAGSKSEQIELPDPEFFAFESNKSEDKFKVGQIWAVYSDDGLPKYYVQIQRIKSSPEFKLVTKWLTHCNEQGDIIKWHDEEMPAGCGTYKLSKEKPEFSPATFSHILNPQPTCKKGEFAIFPAKGEVWALYKKWNPEMKFEGIEDFEYDLAEVLYIDDLCVEVLPLQQVSGHVTVFRRQTKKEVQRIPKTQLLRFSHPIPAFLLTDELDGTLRGCWELDPAAVPPALLIPSG